MIVRSWRLIESGFGNAYWNMSVDQAIMRAVACEEKPPTLRLYGWRPPAVSLGYFQAFDDGIDISECRRRGYDIVRRPTGGRAILHDHEVTYSFCIRQEALRDGRSVMGSYREISRGIVAGLAGLGAQVGLGADASKPARTRARPDTICFAKAARCDLTAGGRKIVGSAQVRRNGAILQHGSIPISISPDDHAAVMPGNRTASVAASSLKGAAAGVAQLLGCPVSFEELSGAVIEGFAEAFEVAFHLEQLSASEEAVARKLCREKYGTAAWNEGRPTSDIRLTTSD